VEINRGSVYVVYNKSKSKKIIVVATGTIRDGYENADKTYFEAVMIAACQLTVMDGFELFIGNGKTIWCNTEEIQNETGSDVSKTDLAIAISDIFLKISPTAAKYPIGSIVYYLDDDGIVALKVKDYIFDEHEDEVIMIADNFADIHSHGYKTHKFIECVWTNKKRLSNCINHLL
jgi:hypothetical protein